MSARARSSPHLVVLLPTFAGGGTERFAVNLAPALAERGWRVNFLVGSEEGLLRRELPSTIEVHNLPSVHAPRAILPAAMHLRRMRPDVVLGLLSFGAYLGLLRTSLPTSTKLVTRPSINLTETLEKELGGPDAWSRMRRRAITRAYRRVDGIIVQSDDMRRDLLRHRVADEKIVHITNPVSLPRDSVRWSSRNDAKPDAPHLVAVGRLDPQKGYDLLLPAFAALVRERPRATLTIYGEGPSRAQLEGVVDGLGLRERVSMPGFSKDAMDRAQEADLFVSSSRYEGLSNALLEALARGIRVLITDCPGGNREVVRDGENGFVCASSSSMALTEGMSRALRERLRMTPDAIADETLARYGLAEVAHQYDVYLRQLSVAS